MITETKRKRMGSMMDRSKIYDHYVAKYFNLFLNRFTFEGDVSDEAIAFFMRQFWKNGTVAVFKLEGSEGSTDYPRGMPVFAPYAPNEYNLYKYPVKATLIPLMGTKIVPTRPMKVDEEVVIGWIQRNKEPVFAVVDYYARRIAAAEMVLNANLNAQKCPWIIATSPEEQQKQRDLANLLLDDNPTLFVEFNDADKAKALVSGAPYVIDKLKNYVIVLENELREYLGLNNLGTPEKKEHLLDSEVQSNNEVTAASGDVFLDCLTEFFDRAREVLGIEIHPKLNQPAMPEAKTEDEQDEEENEE